MKLPSRRARRILLRITASIITLVVLLWAIAGWWAAKLKNDAFQTLKDNGRITSVTDIPRPLPPDHTNFAMLPMFVQMRMEISENLPEKPWTTKLNTFGADPLGNPFRATKRGETFDLEKLRRRHELKGSATELLREFDLSQQEILTQFLAGLDLPNAVTPNSIDFTDPSMYFAASSNEVKTLSRMSAGLIFRAELAIATSQPEIAEESLLILRRLSDLTATGDTMIGLLVSFSIDSRRAAVTARGIEAKLWNQQQLDRLQTSWNPRDTYADVARIINIEGLVGANFLGYLKRNRELIEVLGSDTDRIFSKLLPGSWFDLQAANALSSVETWLQRLENPKSLQTLWDYSIREIDKTNEGDPFTGVGRAAATVIQKFAEHSIRTAQAQVALQLASHHLTHGTYPHTLDSLEPSPTPDPLTGSPFLYQTDGQTFTLYSPGPDQTDNKANRVTDWVW